MGATNVFASLTPNVPFLLQATEKAIDKEEKCRLIRLAGETGKKEKKAVQGINQICRMADCWEKVRDLCCSIN